MVQQAQFFFNPSLLHYIYDIVSSKELKSGKCIFNSTIENSNQKAGVGLHAERGESQCPKEKRPQRG